MRPHALLPLFLISAACAASPDTAADTAQSAPWARTRSADLEVTLALDAEVYTAHASTIRCVTTPCPSNAEPAVARVTLTLENTGRRPATLTLPSAQRFDLQVLGEEGTVLSTWSADKLFMAAVTEVTLAPGEDERWVTELTLGERPGRLTVRATVAGTDAALGVPVHVELAGARAE